MNKIRRSKLNQILNRIEDLKSELETLENEEQEYADNMPENLQDSEKHENSILDVEAMQEAQCSLEEAREHIDEILNR